MAKITQSSSNRSCSFPCLARTLLSKTAVLIMSGLIFLVYSGWFWNQTSTSFHQQQPVERTEAFERAIPHKLWFTFPRNIIDTSRFIRPSDQRFTLNVNKTINAYREAWNDPTAPVQLLEDADCVKVIQEAEPRLVSAFEKERRGSFKGDICRLCALYLHGGYYFDVDMEVIAPVVLLDGENEDGTTTPISFASALDSTFGWFFNSFLASTPRHPILRRNLDRMLEFYKGGGGCIRPRVEPRQVLMGCCTLMEAYDATPLKKRGNNFFLRECHLNSSHPSFCDYPQVPQRGSTLPCHWIVHDAVAKKPYFYSRMVGANHCRQ